MLKFLQLCTRNDVSVETISSLPDAIAHVVYLYCIAIVVLVQGSNPFQGSLVYMYAFSTVPTRYAFTHTTENLVCTYVHQLMKQQQNICDLISTSHILCTYTVYSWVRIPPKNHCTTVYVQYSTDHCALSKRAFTSFSWYNFIQLKIGFFSSIDETCKHI